MELTEKQSPTIASTKIIEYDSEVASCFRIGLDNELIESRVRQENPRSLQEAINAAIDAERDVNRRHRLRGISSELGSHMTEHETKIETDYIIREPRRNINNESYAVNKVHEEPSKSRSRRDNECYTCGEESHISRNCPQRGQFNQNRDNPNKRFKSNNPREKQVGLKCEYCGYKGHNADKCYQRRAEKAENELRSLKRGSSSRPTTSSGDLNSQDARRKGTATSKSILTVHQSDAQCSQSAKKAPSKPRQ